MTTSRIRPRFIDESEFVSIDFNFRLLSGQTLLSVVWTPEAPVTEDAATSAVSDTVASARFTTPAAGQYTIEASVTTQNPTETKVEFVLLEVTAVPT